MSKNGVLMSFPDKVASSGWAQPAACQAFSMDLRAGADTVMLLEELQ